MAAMNFPSSPSDGDTYVANGITYTYNSAETKWKSAISANVYLPLTGGTVSGNILIGGEIQHDGDIDTKITFGTDSINFDTSGVTRATVESTGKTQFSYATYGVERTITAGAFDLNTGNLWTCGAIAIPNPTNAVAGLMGSIRVTAAPVSFGSNFDHPGGSYTAPTTFPAVAPFYCVSSTNILLGSWTEGIA